MLERHKLPVTLWVVAVTLAMAWPIFAPPVTARGMAFREDTMSIEMFDMTGDSYAAIVGAVDSGQLVSSELRDGFKAFTPPGLSKARLAGRLAIAEEVADRYIAEQRATTRPMLIGIWAMLGLVLPGLYLAGRAWLCRKPQPLTAPPVRPEMM